MLKQILTVVCVAMFFSALCEAGEVNVKKLSKQNWINIKSDNFDVLTNAKEKKASAMVRELENFSYFMSLLLGYRQSKLVERVPMILVKDKSSFVSLGMSDIYSGFFVKKYDDNAIIARSDGFKVSSKGGGNWSVQLSCMSLFIC